VLKKEIFLKGCALIDLKECVPMTNCKKLLTLSIFFLVILSLSMIVYADQGVGKAYGEVCKSKAECKSGFECYPVTHSDGSQTDDAVCAYPRCYVGLARKYSSGSLTIREGRSTGKTCSCGYRGNTCFAGEYCMQVGVNSKEYDCQSKSHASMTFNKNVADSKGETSRTADTIVRAGGMMTRAEADLYPSCPTKGDAGKTCACKATATKTYLCSAGETCSVGTGCAYSFGVGGKGTHTSSGQSICTMKRETKEDCVCNAKADSAPSICKKGEMCVAVKGCVEAEYKKSSKSFGGECVSDNECKGDMSCMKLAVYNPDDSVDRKNICEYEECSMDVKANKKCNCKPSGGTTCERGEICHKSESPLTGSTQYLCTTPERYERMKNYENKDFGDLDFCPRSGDTNKDCVCSYSATEGPEVCHIGQTCVKHKGCEGSVALANVVVRCHNNIPAIADCVCGKTSCSKGEVCQLNYISTESGIVQEERCVSKEHFDRSRGKEKKAVEEDEQVSNCAFGKKTDATCKCKLSENQIFYCNPGQVCDAKKGCIAEKEMEFDVPKDKKKYKPSGEKDPAITGTCKGLECGSITIRLKGPGIGTVWMRQGTPQKVQAGEKYQIRFKANKNKLATKCLKIDGTTYPGKNKVVLDVIVPDDSTKTFRVYAYADKDCTVRVPRVSVSVNLFAGTGKGNANDSRKTTTDLTKAQMNEIEEEVEILYKDYYAIEKAGELEYSTHTEEERKSTYYKLTNIRNRAKQLQKTVSDSVEGPRKLNKEDDLEGNPIALMIDIDRLITKVDAGIEEVGRSVMDPAAEDEGGKDVPPGPPGSENRMMPQSYVDRVELVRSEIVAIDGTITPFNSNLEGVNIGGLGDTEVDSMMNELTERERKLSTLQNELYDLQRLTEDHDISEAPVSSISQADLLMQIDLNHGAVADIQAMTQKDLGLIIGTAGDVDTPPGAKERMMPQSYVDRVNSVQDEIGNLESTITPLNSNLEGVNIEGLENDEKDSIMNDLTDRDQKLSILQSELYDLQRLTEDHDVSEAPVSSISQEDLLMQITLHTGAVSDLQAQTEKDLGLVIGTTDSVDIDAPEGAKERMMPQSYVDRVNGVQDDIVALEGTVTSLNSNLEGVNVEGLGPEVAQELTDELNDRDQKLSILKSELDDIQSLTEAHDVSEEPVSDICQQDLLMQINLHQDAVADLQDQTDKDILQVVGTTDSVDVPSDSTETRVPQSYVDRVATVEEELYLIDSKKTSENSNLGGTDLGDLDTDDSQAILYELEDRQRKLLFLQSELDDIHGLTENYEVSEEPLSDINQDDLLGQIQLHQDDTAEMLGQTETDLNAVVTTMNFDDMTEEQME